MDCKKIQIMNNVKSTESRFTINLRRPDCIQYYVVYLQEVRANSGLPTHKNASLITPLSECSILEKISFEFYTAKITFSLYFNVTSHRDCAPSGIQNARTFSTYRSVFSAES